MGFQISEFEFQTFLLFFDPLPYLEKSPQFSRFLIMMPPIVFYFLWCGAAPTYIVLCCVACVKNRRIHFHQLSLVKSLPPDLGGKWSPDLFIACVSDYRILDMIVVEEVIEVDGHKEDNKCAAEGR